ncbi:MAG TPA: hypothetical protein VLN74_02225 [Ilumatobacteraceae bacterium]|nr:hypothetical protein [Ilumatobacteraceae bacterium]
MNERIPRRMGDVGAGSLDLLGANDRQRESFLGCPRAHVFEMRGPVDVATSFASFVPLARQVARVPKTETGNGSGDHEKDEDAQNRALPGNRHRESTSNSVGEKRNDPIHKGCPIEQL